jgi:SagB-type dehydrogenase family enzyme
VRSLRPTDRGDLSDRPYPGAGAVYELELYPVVDRCDGLAAGLYHYDPLAHQLERLSGPTPETQGLLDEARSPGGPSERPDVLLVIAARFPRVSWKYESIAYALVMQDVGALMQTFYLVATAMSLAPYALGRSAPDLFHRAAGVDGYTETSVGAFGVSGAVG